LIPKVKEISNFFFDLFLLILQVQHNYVIILITEQKATPFEGKKTTTYLHATTLNLKPYIACF